MVDQAESLEKEALCHERAAKAAVPLPGKRLDDLTAYVLRCEKRVATKEAATKAATKALEDAKKEEETAATELQEAQEKLRNLQSVDRAEDLGMGAADASGAETGEVQALQEQLARAVAERDAALASSSAASEREAAAAARREEDAKSLGTLGGDLGKLQAAFADDVRAGQAATNDVILGKVRALAELTERVENAKRQRR